MKDRAYTMQGAPFSPLLRLAWRNLWRHRQRTILLLVVVAYATFFTIAYWSFIDGYGDSIIESYAGYIVAPVRIATDAWYDDPDPENYLPDLTVIDALEAIAEVGVAAPRLHFPGLLQSAYVSRGVEVRGVDPAAEPGVSRIPGKIVEGRWLAGSGEVVLGREMAQRVDARVGEQVVVSAGALAGPQAIGVTVVGIAATGVRGVDETAVIISLDDARRLTGVPTATTVALGVPRGSEAAVADRVQAVLPPGVAALGVWDLVGPIKADVEVNKVFAHLLSFVVYLFAALAVTTTIIVSVMERTRELGVIGALGVAPRRIGALVMLESFYACGLGWLFGLVLGYGAAWVLARYNILGPLFALFSAAIPTAGFSEEVYGAVRASYAAYSGLVVVVALVLTALFPARRAVRLRSIEAMRD